MSILVVCLVCQVLLNVAWGNQPYVYPDKGQNLGQQERDKQECHVWAVRQTGFDPAAPQVGARA
jgi:hypothetical protein